MQTDSTWISINNTQNSHLGYLCGYPGDVSIAGFESATNTKQSSASSTEYNWVIFMWSDEV